MHVCCLATLTTNYYFVLRQLFCSFHNYKQLPVLLSPTTTNSDQLGLSTLSFHAPTRAQHAEHLFLVGHCLKRDAGGTLL
jgi:hypothetical protein